MNQPQQKVYRQPYLPEIKVSVKCKIKSIWKVSKLRNLFNLIIKLINLWVRLFKKLCKLLNELFAKIKYPLPNTCQTDKFIHN